MFEENTNNLFIVAHPDDEVFGISGTILKLNEKKNNNYIILCTGYSSDFTSRRYKKFIESCEILNLESNENKNSPFSKLFACDIKLQDVENLIYENLKLFKKKNIIFNNIFTHSKSDFHQDHKIVHDAVYLNFRPYIYEHKINLITFETYDSSNNYYSRFNPNLFIDLDSKYLSKKLEIIESIYNNYINNGRNKESIIHHMSRYGSLVNTKYCEAFEIIRMIM
jgi:hypothetical protein